MKGWNQAAVDALNRRLANVPAARPAQVPAARQTAARPVKAHADWLEIGGKRLFARSRWEANYACYLEFLKTHGQIADWEHEAGTFWFLEVKRGVRSYLPDFRVVEIDGSVTYHEVKGWMDPNSKTKLRRMAKYHPTVVVRVIDGKWFQSNARKLAGVVPGWQSSKN